MGWLDFLKDANTEKKTASRAFSFLPSVASPAGVVDQVVSHNREKVNRLTADVLRATPREAVSIGASIHDAVAPRDQRVGKLNVSNPVARAVLGDGEIQTLQTRQKGTESTIQRSPFRGAATPLSFLGVGLTSAMNLAPVGGEGKTGKEIIDQLAKETTEQGVKSIAKKVGIDLADDVARAVSITKDKHVIGNLLNNKTAELTAGLDDGNLLARNYVEHLQNVQGEGAQLPRAAQTIEDVVKNGEPDAVAAARAKFQNAAKGLSDPQSVTKPTAGQDIVSATVPKSELKITSRNPSTSKDLAERVTSGKLQDSVEYAPTKSLKLGGDTYGELDPARVAKYKADIQAGKTVDPLIIDSKGLVVDGKHRLKAAEELGIKNVPTAQQVEPKQLSGAAQQAKLSKNIAEPFDEISGALTGRGGIAAKSREQAALLSKERGARFKAAGEAGKTAEGSEGYFKQLGKLKGEYSKVEFKPMVGDIGPERAEELFSSARQKINSTGDDVYHELGLHPEAARVNTQRAVRKVLGLEPGLPTKSELRLLSVYSPKLAEEVKAATPVHRKLLDYAADVFGSTRSLKSSVDFSMGGRQGLFVAARHPVEWAKANIESVKYAKDGQYYKDSMRAIHGDEWGQLIDRYKPSLLTGGGKHEEAYAGSDLLTGKLAKDKLKAGNLIAGSERAYTGGLTYLRKERLTKLLKSYGATAEEAEKNLGKKGIDGLLETVGTLTGRGGKAGGFVEKHATTLQEALFSPRLWASRLQPLNPAFWKRIGPAGRKEALQNLGSFAAVAGTVLAAAVAAGAEVETDPRSSDFLKIKVGDTRYDILGGFQQNLVFGARQLSNSTKSSTTGAVTKYGSGFGKPTRLSAAADLVRNKANPAIGAAANILEGKDKAGNSINPLTEVGQLFVPISLQNAFNSRDNPKDILKGLPDLVGVGSQTYGLKDTRLTDKQQRTVGKLTDKKQQEAYTRFYQTQKQAQGRKQNVSDDIDKALAAKDLTKAKKLAQEYNSSYSSAFKDWRSQYQQQADRELLKEFNSGKITLDNAAIKARLKKIKENS